MPSEQWERRQGMRQADGWRWHRWEPCSDAEAQRVTGLQSWEVRQCGQCAACAGTGRAPLGVKGLRLLTGRERQEAYSDCREDESDVEALQRKFCEVNGLPLPDGVPVADECGTCRKALPSGCNTEFQGEQSCALTHGVTVPEAPSGYPSYTELADELRAFVAVWSAVPSASRKKMLDGHCWKARDLLHRMEAADAAGSRDVAVVQPPWRLTGDAIIKQDGEEPTPQRFLKAGTVVHLAPPHDVMGVDRG